MNPELSAEKLQELLDKMSYVGILEYDYGDNYDHNGPIPGAKRNVAMCFPCSCPALPSSPT